jgi:hypothetical protein
MKLSKNEVGTVKGKLLRGVEMLHDATSSGEDPNAAAVKVASKLQLTHGQIRLLAQSFNTGQSAGCRQRSILAEKAAEFALVDPDTVISEVYRRDLKPASVKAAEAVVSREYREDPHWLEARAKTATRTFEKVAALPDAPAMPEPLEVASRRAKAASLKVREEREKLYAELFDLREKISASLVSLESYFHRPGAILFSQLRDNCTAKYGEKAAAVLDRFSRIPQYEPETRLRPVNDAVEPYVHVKTILEKAAACEEFFLKAAQFEKNAAKTVLSSNWAVVQPTALPPDASLSVLQRMAGEKRAWHAKKSSAVEGIGQSIMAGLSPKSPEKMKDDAFADLTSPDHERRLRAIRAKAIMQELLESPFFAGENPQHVADAFNSVTQLSPRLIENPVALESVLRKHISQGQADPHDLSQILDVDKSLKERDALPDARQIPVVAPTALRS